MESIISPAEPVVREEILRIGAEATNFNIPVDQLCLSLDIWFGLLGRTFLLYSSVGHFPVPTRQISPYRDQNRNRRQSHW